MALERAVAGALTHAELVDLAVRQSALIDRLPAALAEQQGVVARLGARVREVARGRVRVVEHAYLERRWPNPACRARVVPPRASAAELGVASARGRLGVGLVGLIAALRAELRLPLAGIQWYLGAVHGLELSE